MHKQLQQLKEFLDKFGIFYSSLLYICLLPIYSGNIVSPSLAGYFGQYINFLHIRITLHDLVALLVVVFFYRNADKAINQHKRLLLVCIALVALSLFPVRLLSEQLGVSFLMLEVTSSAHLFSFLLNATALILASSALLAISTTKKAGLIMWGIGAISVLEGLLVLGQILIKCPLFGTLLTWTGQPAEFTSKAIWGIYEFARAYGTTPHPNIFAAIMVFYVFLVLATAINKKITPLLVCLLSTLVIATLSKIGAAALVLVLLCYASQNLLSKLPLLTTRVFWSSTLIGYLSIIAVNLGIFISQVSMPYLQSRAVIQQLYIELLAYRPYLLLTGTGFSFSIPTLLQSAPLLQTSTVWGSRILAEPPHNILLLLVTEVGILGTVLVLWYIHSIGNGTFSTLAHWKRVALLSIIILFGGLDHLLAY